MKRWPGPVLAALPGLALALAALLGPTPTVRDLPSYFTPLRTRTAEVLRGSRGPFWNKDAGCGEPFFANPQTVLLYPPGWLALVLPAERAVGVEAGLHLAWLAVGCALLARRLGASSAWLEAAAGWGVALAGPLADAAGVLNNLDGVAWLPWLALAALGGSLPGTALAAAASFLAAEPQLALVGFGIALTLAPRRRTLAGLALGLGLVAVQAIPFAAWVGGGDRGPGQAFIDVTAGGLAPADLAAMAFPGVPSLASGSFVVQLAVPLWVLLFGAVAVFDRRTAVRRLAWCGFGLLLIAVAAGLPVGREIWATLTLGLLRYPGRLLFPGLVALAPAATAAVGARRAPAWCGVAVAASGIVGVVLGGAVAECLGGAAAAGAALTSPWAGPAALAGAALLAPRQAAALELRSPGARPPVACIAAQRGAGRVFLVQPSRDQAAWVVGDRLAREAALGWGYTPLLDCRRAARSFAPLSPRPLSAHLAEADRGPAGRWWLDTLAARRIVANHEVLGFPELCRDGELVVLDNAQAWPEASVARAIPAPGDPLVPAGEVRVVEDQDDLVVWRVRVDAPRAVLLRLATPDPGWSYLLDGRPATVVSGPGIIHGIAVGPGEHEVRARYRPPGLAAGGAISLLSVLAVVGVAWRRW